MTIVGSLCFFVSFIKTIYFKLALSINVEFNLIFFSMKRVLFLLGHLKDRDVEWMINNGKKETIATNDRLITKGVAIEKLYIILSGSFSVVDEVNTGKSIAQIGVGEVVGEMSFLESRPPSVSVVAEETSSVYSISREMMQNRFDIDTEFKANFYYAIALFLSNRLRRTTEQLGFDSPEETDMVDEKILDGIAQAGERFNEILKKFSEV